MSVFARSQVRSIRLNLPVAAGLARAVLSAVRESTSDMSLTFVGDHRMRRLNRRYRGKDRSTDVLAFAARDVRVSGSNRLTRGILGDVVISIPTAARQARHGGRSLGEEVAALLVHGILHLCGYDHERGEAEARRMHRRERAILKRLKNIPRLTHP